MIKMVFCDIDGCMGDFVKPEYPLKQDIQKNKENLILIGKKTNEFKDVMFGVATGRSYYQADNIMEFSNHQGPSVFEMGNVIFDPDEGVYFLFEKHEKFKNHLNKIKLFLEWKENMKSHESEIKKRFPLSNIRQMKDRICMLTYEFDSNIGEELYSFIKTFMLDEILNALNEKILKVLMPKNSIDILPNISKGDAVSFLIQKYGIKKEEVLAIGDSTHSDIDLLKSAGFVACPFNAEDEVKEFVYLNNGFVAPNLSSEGLLNILDFYKHYIKFINFKNG